MRDKYHISEIFYSLQGEGVRTGTPNVFVRFAHCNLACSIETEGWSCDTEFDSYQEMEGKEIVEVARIAAQEFAQDGKPFPMAVIFTGGEPALQIDQELVNLFRVDGWYIAIETNGTRLLPEVIFDWICVSPKSAAHSIKTVWANEVKYVRRAGQKLPNKPVVEADHWLVSPAFASSGCCYRGNLEWCIDLVKQNPRWRLSVQAHKFLGIR